MNKIKLELELKDIMTTLAILSKIDPYGVLTDDIYKDIKNQTDVQVKQIQSQEEVRIEKK